MKLLPILAAGFAYYALGGLWFTPLFGSHWDKAIGFERPQKWRPGVTYYIGPLLGCGLRNILPFTTCASPITRGLSTSWACGWHRVWRNHYHGKRHRTEHASSRPVCRRGGFVSLHRLGALQRSLVLALVAEFQCKRRTTRRSSGTRH